MPQKLMNIIAISFNNIKLLIRKRTLVSDEKVYTFIPMKFPVLKPSALKI